jgi:hypothetical protein
MRIRVSILSLLGAIIALQTAFPAVSQAADSGDPALQQAERRWVPSFAITAGATIQNQDGSADSVLFQDGSTTPVPLQGRVDGNDLGVAPFVGGSLELMTPALPIPTRPRFFLGGEILPTFSADHALAIEGDPGCITGPKPGDPCAKGITVAPTSTFTEAAANGEGTKLTATVDTLVYGADLGVAFPIRAGKRQLRIKPSLGWINFKIDASAKVVNAACNPSNRCTDQSIEIFPGSPPLIIPGFLRETVLQASDSKRFNGIGPGLDIEMGVGRYGPLGVSLFLGARAYRVLGDRSFSFTTSESFDDQLGMDVATGTFDVEVAPWMYRGNLGIRFEWLGSAD